MLTLLQDSEKKAPPPDTRTPAQRALAAARERLEAAKGQRDAETSALAKASQAAREAEAELEATKDTTAPAFSGFVRGVGSAHALVEAVGDRLDRAKVAVAVAERAVEEAERELKRETIRRLDEEIRVDNQRILEQLVGAARAVVDQVAAMKAKAGEANALEESLPGYKAPWDGRPSCRLSALVDAPHPYAPTSASEILFQAAHYAAATSGGKA